MQRLKGPLALVFMLSLTACGSKANDTFAQRANREPARTRSRINACTLMPKEDVNAITGDSYTTAESNDDGHSSSSDCHYASSTNPAGASVSITWINPSDYSDPAEHLALQKASLGGANLAGKLIAGMVGNGIPGVPSGPVEGIGDEAAFNMLLLTARKGDYTIMVQIIPTNMISFMTDSTAAAAFVEKEKTIARKVFTRI